VFGLWQLVDVFEIVDAQDVAIHASPTLINPTIQAIPRIEFPSETVTALKITSFAR